jgi:hypothetical protein
MRGLSAAAILCVLSFSAAGASDDWGHDFDAIIAEPGTKVFFGTMNGGDPTREIRLANGVTVTQIRHAGKLSAFTTDNSGHGAVMCNYAILLALQGALSLCDLKSPEAAEIAEQIPRIEAFIIANVLPRTATNEAAARTEIGKLKARNDAAASSLAPEKKAAYCKSSNAALITSRYRAQWGEGKLNKMVDDLLSVPRPAVTNPCL